ncbi:hypothetical protein C8Q76DRAFT_388468 [Earliella scabrosa]|nr:hypothetical protein C8Q76DRAFT_388468 [Earliella scabrosa]
MRPVPQGRESLGVQLWVVVASLLAYATKVRSCTWEKADATSLTYYSKPGVGVPSPIVRIQHPQYSVFLWMIAIRRNLTMPIDPSPASAMLNSVDRFRRFARRRAQ